MSQALIRPYSAADAESIVQIIVDYRSETARTAPDRQAIAGALASFASSAEHRILVAERANRLLGYSAFHFVPFPMVQGVELYVSDLLIAAEARGSGVGSCLLQAVEAEARARGCVRIMLNNHKTEASYTRQFYPKHEFREREEFANFVKRLG